MLDSIESGADLVNVMLRYATAVVSAAISTAYFRTPGTVGLYSEQFRLVLGGFELLSIADESDAEVCLLNDRRLDDEEPDVTVVDDRVTRILMPTDYVENTMAAAYLEGTIREIGERVEDAVGRMLHAVVEPFSPGWGQFACRIRNGEFARAQHQSAHLVFVLFQYDPDSEPVVTIRSAALSRYSDAGALIMQQVPNSF